MNGLFSPRNARAICILSNFQPSQHQSSLPCSTCVNAAIGSKDKPSHIWRMPILRLLPLLFFMALSLSNCSHRSINTRYAPALFVAFICWLPLKTCRSLFDPVSRRNKYCSLRSIADRRSGWRFQFRDPHLYLCDLCLPLLLASRLCNADFTDCCVVRALLYLCSRHSFILVFRIRFVLSYRATLDLYHTLYYV